MTVGTFVEGMPGGGGLGLYLLILQGFAAQEIKKLKRVIFCTLLKRVAHLYAWILKRNTFIEAAPSSKQKSQQPMDL